MILKSQDKQFSISDNGEIFFQPDPTNPLPGTPVAKVVKGDSLLHPKAQSTLPEGTAPGIDEKLQEWLDKSLEAALEPLFRLVRGEDLTGAAKDIAEKIHQSLGIIPRDQIQSHIATLDDEGRKGLRARKVRMGPLLVFLPELNKPVAVKLRAMLLTLWQDKPLPAAHPADGMVSFPVVDKDIDPDYYRSIGYPVYGPRSIRVDMMDRVVCAVYDTAKDGQFQAQHKMAEWLGCNITDLYAVLEAMGHTKINDPMEKKIAEELSAPAPAPEEIKPEEKTPEPAVEPVAETAETPAAAETPKAEKPELATFRLRRGGPARAPRADKRADAKPKEPRIFWERDKDMRPEKPAFNKDKKNEFGNDKPKFKKDKFKKDGRDDDRGERIYTAEAKVKHDSPFAILQQLKTGNDGQG